MKVGKIIGRVALGALILSAVPYQFNKNEDNGTLEVRSLLWGWRKTPPGDGEGSAHYCFAIPASWLDDAAEKEAESLAEEPLVEGPTEA